MNIRRRLISTVSFGRVFIIVPAAIMLIHCIVLSTGCRFGLELAENIVVTLLAYALWRYDKALGFCLMHRLSILYPLAVVWCINFHKYFGFGPWLRFMHIVMIVYGAIHFILLFTLPRCQNNQSTQNSNS